MNERSLFICPRCQERYARQPHSGDYVHQCNSGNETLDNEDVVLIGTWEDYTGSETVSTSQVQVAGTVNELQGTRAGIEGENFDQVTVRGNRKSTHRSRRHEEYVPHDC